jgi:hypothetical protein
MSGIYVPVTATQQLKVLCNTCGHWDAPDPNRPGCVMSCPNRGNANGNTATATATATATPSTGPATSAPAQRDRPMYETQRLGPTPFSQHAIQSCEPIGAPYPCTPTMTPDGRKVFGAAVPLSECECANLQEAVRKMCFLGVSIQSGTIATGASAVIRIELKWWFQIQMILNLGDQTNPTFRLTNIRYGQSNYAPEFIHLSINGVAIPDAQRGIDVRVWNITGLYPKFHPIPACAINDSVYLTFTNVTADNQVLALHFGGPALLQIG